MNPLENPPLDEAAFLARLDAALQRHAATQPAYWPVTDRAAQPSTITLPDTAASLIAAFLTSARGVTKLRPWEEVADRLVEYMRESWRPVPAEAADPEGQNR